MDQLEALLKRKSSMRFIFTGGKGGVGKTVAAAGLSCYFAKNGRRCLIASLNPVHSLSSLFNQDLKGGGLMAVEGIRNLYAVEVEIKDIVEKYRENIGRRVKDFLKWADIPVDAKPFIDIAVTNPAFEESAMFDKMMDIMLKEGEEFDVIVFDTAAVANAIRLIGLSKIYGLWLNRMIESRKEALSMRIQLSFRKEKVMEEVKKDPLMADLINMNERFLKVKKLLTDAEITAFFFVTLPLALPIAVVKRFINMVMNYDIPVGGVIVNQVLEKKAVEQNPDEEYLKNKFEEQLGYLKIIKNDLGDLTRSFIPLYPCEVTGCRMVERVSSDMLGFYPEFWKEI